MELKNTQLKKGIIEALILYCLKDESHYGYEIIQLLDDASDGIFKMKEGTFYPILYRLEDSEFVESYWIHEQDKRGKPRKYYRITNKGKTLLNRSIEEWSVFSQTVSRILNI